MGVPEVHREWALHLRDNTPGAPSVQSFHDEGGTHAIDIFFSADSDGAVAATIGLMDIDIRVPGSDDPVFTEILIDSKNGGDTILNVLSTVAFYIMKDGWRPAPGVIFEQMIEMYEPSLAVKHIMFVPPFQWSGDEMTRVALSSRTIYPLLAVPITNPERDFAVTRGSDALQLSMEHGGVDVFDWKRASSV